VTSINSVDPFARSVSIGEMNAFDFSDQEY
jgi:hypothetical protein